MGAGNGQVGSENIERQYFANLNSDHVCYFRVNLLVESSNLTMAPGRAHSDADKTGMGLYSSLFFISSIPKIPDLLKKFNAF